MNEVITRVARVEDANVEGRTVEAYAAVFDSPTAIRSLFSEFQESVASSAFNKSVSEKKSFPVIYNHGMTLDGEGNGSAAIPIGVSEEIKPDGYGLYTRSRYHNDPYADRVLEAVRSGSINGQSFGAYVLATTETRNEKSQRLESRVLTELKLREYGPTPFPQFEGAKILSVKSALQDFDNMNNDDRADIIDQIKRYLSDEEIRQLVAPLPEGAGPEPHLDKAGENEARRARVRARLYKMGVL